MSVLHKESPTIWAVEIFHVEDSIFSQVAVLYHLTITPMARHPNNLICTRHNYVKYFQWQYYHYSTMAGTTAKAMLCNLNPEIGDQIIRVTNTSPPINKLQVH